MEGSTQKGEKVKPKSTRSRSGSLSEGTGARMRTRSMTSTTSELQEEPARMAQVAAAAADKAARHQKKMTDYVGRQESPSGAGELPPGPCGSAAPASTGGRDPNPRMDTSEANPTEEEVEELLNQARRGQDQDRQAAQASQDAEDPAREDQGTPDEAEGDWQIWSSRRRRIGADLGPQDQRQIRERTPFQLPGRQVGSSSGRGYYSSANRRQIAIADSRSSRLSSAAALTDQQWKWFSDKLCLGCGATHQVKDCPRLTPAQAKGLLRAAFSCPTDMRPSSRRQRPRVPPPPTDPARKRSAAAPAEASASAAGTAASTARGGPGGAAAMPAPTPKRDRDGGKSGYTPEAKKAKMFSEAVRSNLILYVREKDGAPLTKERFQALRTSFTYYVEDMLANNKDPPICSGRWVESRTVVKIPMASEEDLLWMRCFLDKAYMVQSEKEFKESKSPTYVAFLRDRLEPELTNMRQEKLASFVRYFRRQANITSLFELKMAAKTTRGKAIHLIMDEDAERIFVKAGCRICFAASGWISFEERQAYIARIKALERDRLRPRASDLEQGRAVQGVQQMRLDDDGADVVVVDLEKEGERHEEPEAGGSRTVAVAEQEETDRRVRVRFAQTLCANLQKDVKDGRMDQSEADSKMLEQTGMTMADMATKRTVSGSSWSEEVEHMKGLEDAGAAGAAEESAEAVGDEEDRDQAHFEMRQERKAPGGRAVGSHLTTERAVGSTSNKN